MTKAPDPRFWNRVAQKYAARPLDDPQAFERKLDMIRAHLTPASRLLELGCGTGTTAVALAPHTAHIDATDLSSAMLGIARDRAEAAGVTNITFREQTVEGFSPTDTPYDMVLALSLLHLLDDPRAALATIHGMLKPGGLFVSSTICARDSYPWLPLIGPPLRWIGLIPKIHGFSRATLEAMITAAGFAIEEAYHPTRRAGVFLIARKT